MMSEYLMLILVWCNSPGSVDSKQISYCRKDKIECVRALPKKFTVDDMIDQCLTMVKK